MHGSPSSALLEVLDDSRTFRDNYLEITYNLSEVIFLCTANSARNIHPTLYNRMEVINLPSYTEGEKAKIAESYILPALLNEFKLDPALVSFNQESLRTIIEGYT